MQQDLKARQQALDPKQSFIVQAPAGSGKTELLMQRYLKLLSTAVNEPEEILAITFTRKAAGEMRERILMALNETGQQNTPPTEAHLLTRWQLARQVLQKNKALAWGLLENPNRLRIQTIDSLATTLTARLPLKAGYGSQLTMSKDPQPFYQKAIHKLISDLSADKPWTKPLTHLLMHLDNQVPQLEALLSDLLARRDQWLPHIVPFYREADSLRHELEQGLSNLLTELMQTVDRLMDTSIKQSLLSLATFAGNNLQNSSPDHPLCQWAKQNHWPGTEATDIELWRALASLLLTTQGKWRSRVDKRMGFPAKGSTENEQHKQHLIELLALLKSETSLEHALTELQFAPPTTFTDQQWQVIQALTELLPLLSSELQLVFQATGTMDFVELGLAASRALGHIDNPTELALALDTKIQHLLVDEFQDTSLSQYQLLHQLTAGWQAGDGRTLFLVGDPMQSIYRFRNAEVGLFLRTQQQGLNAIQLQSLTLSLNFRSQKGLIHWFNQVFPKVLADKADILTGAVPYTPASSLSKNIKQGSVKSYPLIKNEGLNEAQQTALIIKQLRQQNSDCSITILVRSRSHLREIVPHLRQEKLNFQAIEIESLAHCEEIRDLYTLSRALLHLADRVAWLALLRSPCCGLSLADLLALTEYAGKRPLTEALEDFSKIKALSPDGQARLARVAPPLLQTLANKGRQALAEWIEGCWLALGMPATYQQTSQLKNAKAYFNLLNELDQQSSPFSLELLNNKLDKLFANSPADADPRLQVMTIHKSKGLEFDHVILPGLNSKSPPNPSRLLLWLERPNLAGDNDLLLAPLKASSEDHDPHYHYLRRIDKSKTDNENARLLYVAATRAKHSLHLITTLERDDKDSKQTAQQTKKHFKKAKPQSFCLLLREHYQTEVDAASQAASIQQDILTDEEPEQDRNPLQRLVRDWQLPPLSDDSEPQFKLAQTSKANSPRPQAINNPARAIGTAIHQALAEIATEIEQDKNDYLNKPQEINKFRSRWQHLLRQHRLLPQQFDRAEQQLLTALQNSVTDPKGRWILDPKHQQAKNEWALTASIDNKLTHSIIDRTFIDKNNCRWIIDYKTATPSTEQTDSQFLLAEREQYQAQLEHYAQVIALYDQTQQTELTVEETRLGLYFPLAKLWCEWA